MSGAESRNLSQKKRRTSTIPTETPPPVCETLAIGDEILTGRIADTNSAYVGDHLYRLGLRLSQQTVIPDEEETITTFLQNKAANPSPTVVFCFGGLGPTSDDKTVDTVASWLGTEAIPFEPASLRLQTHYQQRNRKITPAALKQIRYPKACEPIPNEVGLAPAFYAKKGQCEFYFMPGVPREMKPIFEQQVFPLFLKRASIEHQRPLHSKVFRCLDVAESDLQTALEPIESALPPGGYLGYRTQFPENHVTLYWKSDDVDSYRRQCGILEQVLRPWCYGQGLEPIEAHVIEALKKQNQSLALVESCTGGLVSNRLTQIPGASEVFWGSVTAYQVGAKQQLLGVDVTTAEQAVSQSCSFELAQRIREKSQCLIGGAITGYMGPGGGTSSDPVGTAYLCVSGNSLREKRINMASRDRIQMQWGASTYLLHQILKLLSDQI